MKTKCKIIGLLSYFLLIISCNQNKDAVKYKSDIIILIKNLDNSEAKDIDKNKRLDALSKYLLACNNDSINRNLIFKVATKYYYLNNYDKYFQLTNKVYKLSIEKKDTNHIAKSLRYMGDYYNDTSHLDSAFSYYNKSEELFKNKKDTLMEGTLSLLKAGVLFDTGNFAESETETVKALQLLSKANNIDLVYNCYNVMAISLKGLNNCKKSLYYFNLALKQLDKLEKEKYPKDIVKSRIACFNNMGRVYEKMENYSEAAHFYHIALQTKNIKKEYPRKYAMVLDNLAHSKMQARNFKGVLEILNESSRVSDSLDIKPIIVSNKINFGQYFLSKKDTLKALTYLKEGFALSRKIKNSELTLQSLKLLSENDVKNKNYFTNLYIKVSDSVLNKERTTRNKFARIAYETDQVEEKNVNLSKMITNVFISSGIIVFLLGGILFIYRLKARNKELLFIKEQQEANEKIYQLMLHQQTETEQARNEVRNRIAMELHDGIVNSIFTTRFNLMQLDSGALDKKQQLIEELEKAENEIRKVSHDLQKNLLFEDQTLPEILTNLIEYQKNEFNTKFDLSVDKYIDWSSISSDAKIHVYRIVQEALQNSNKHSKAERCCVFILKTADKITLQIWDNGIGFQPKKTKQGIGLKNIKERTKALNGVLKITSSEAKGTTIEVVF